MGGGKISGLVNKFAALGAGFLIVAPAAALAAAPAISSFTPGAGALGSYVAITGTGFSGATSVTFDGVAAGYAVKSATLINASVPATGTGAIAVTTASGTGTSSSSFTVTPSLSLSTSSGHESLAVTVTGAGFAPYNLIDVYFDTTDEVLAVSNSLGVVSIAFQIPATAQPGTHWITLGARASGIGAQHAFTVNTDWAMQGFNPSGRGANPFENTLFNTNVIQLTESWSQTIGGYPDTATIVEAGGNLYASSADDTISAYSATGTLLWTASSPEAYSAANASLVFFGSGSSVHAYALACHTNGAVCTPTWTATLPGTATVSAGLTLNQNTLYAPGSDGNIYPITPSTGAVGTAISGGTSGAAITTQVNFGADGSLYYAAGNTFFYHPYYTQSGIDGFDVSAPVSTPVVSAGRAFFTSGAGKLYSYYDGWSAATSGTGCYPAPVVAYDTVYAGGCSTIGAFEAQNGTPVWSVTTNGPVIGLSVANGVLYGCVNNRSVGYSFIGELVAYDAIYGNLLWSGGGCSTPPIVVNGAVYATMGTITAYTLPGISPNYVRPKPALYSLRPNPKLAAQRTPDPRAR
jgi:hypothetical protein